MSEYSEATASVTTQRTSTVDAMNEKKRESMSIPFSISAVPRTVPITPATSTSVQPSTELIGPQPVLDPVMPEEDDDDTPRVSLQTCSIC
ncbi:unnamed protein product [Toxocara canis]|uniref:Uncharacterized protein n=1 Tax=Toxocara canis TaxID=6265 RepID=A0A183U8R6_TOXCA|nr:unnamed protein product [Toxocara canis]